jgi:hypothetical protein
MRALAAAVLVALVAPLSAADKNEDRAREVAGQFLKALKARDADALMRAAATPFVYRAGDKVVVITDEAVLKKWLKDKLDEIKDPDTVSTEVKSLYTFTEIRDKIRDKEQQKTVERVLGKGGFAAVFSADDKVIPILIRVTDGKAKIVGVGR